MLAMPPSVETLSPWLDPNLTNHLTMLVGIFLLGGLVRGATGFGGAMVMILPLASIYAMPQAIAISILLELFGPLLLLRSAFRQVYDKAHTYRLLHKFVLWSVLGLPIGLFAQGILDTNVVGLIASFVIAFIALAMLVGAQRLLPRVSNNVSRGLGLACGSLIALTGIGGPVAASYFMNAINEPRLVRSMMHLYATVMSIATITLMLGVGFVGKELFPPLALGLPVYIIATSAGQHLTGFISPNRLRQFILLFILASSGFFLLRFLPVELV
jgi:uncharacterized membrane protein YfcA